MVKPYKIALSVVCIALLGTGIAGIVYYHDPQDAKADVKSSYGSRNTTTGASPSGGSPSMIKVSSSSSCNGDTSSDACQEYVDRGGFVNISYYNGASNVYAAHRELGGSTVLGWHVGQKVSIDGKVYTVTNKKYNVGVSDVPTSGTYAQTCNTDGERVLVGLQ